MVYATFSDLAARWPDKDFTSAEQATAEVLLADAAVIIDAACPCSDGPTEAQEAQRLMVSCAMVKRAMAVPGGLGVNSVQQGAGPYQETVTYANPSGNLYLTKDERKLLGCGGQVAFTVSMRGDDSCSPLAWLP